MILINNISYHVYLLNLIEKHHSCEIHCVLCYGYTIKLLKLLIHIILFDNLKDQFNCLS